MCVPCEAKRRANEDAQGAVDSGENLRGMVERLVEHGRLTEDQAGLILQPLTELDEHYARQAKEAWSRQVGMMAQLIRGRKD